MADKVAKSHKHFRSEFVKFQGKDCVILDIRNDETCKIWDIDSGDIFTYSHMSPLSISHIHQQRIFKEVTWKPWICHLI